MRQLIIDNKIITDNSECFVVAEIGHNHCGDLKICKQLFKAAKECGADAVKLQKRNNKKLFTKALYNQPYDNEYSYGKTYGEHREALEFGYEEYAKLKEYAASLGIIFFATAFDIDSADFLYDLDMPIYKIASGDITNIPLINHIANFNKPMIISTGGATMEDIVRVIGAIPNNNFAFLHCIASYPNKAEEMNLNVIKTMQTQFPMNIIGLSDHYNGICMAEAAFVMGARIIEKHFTLNHTWKGTDHALSLEPQGLKKLCRDLKRINVAMGDGVKRKLPQEETPIRKMGKSIHLAHPIKSGTIIMESDINIVSPTGSLPPYEYENVIDKVTISDLTTSDKLKWEDFEDGHNPT